MSFLLEKTFMNRVDQQERITFNVYDAFDEIEYGPK